MTFFNPAEQTLCITIEYTQQGWNDHQGLNMFQGNKLIHVVFNTNGVP